MIISRFTLSGGIVVSGTVWSSGDLLLSNGTKLDRGYLRPNSSVVLFAKMIRATCLFRKAAIPEPPQELASGSVPGANQCSRLIRKHRSAIQGEDSYGLDDP
jgi:hypothetical protein